MGAGNIGGIRVSFAGINPLIKAIREKNAQEIERQRKHIAALVVHKLTSIERDDGVERNERLYPFFVGIRWRSKQIECLKTTKEWVGDAELKMMRETLLEEFIGTNNDELLEEFSLATQKLGIHDGIIDKE